MDPTAIGSLTGLKEGEVLLPSFVRRGEDGLYVELNAIDSTELFRSFVERVFSSGARFAGLDYEVFRKLAFEYEAEDIGRLAEQLEKQGKKAELKLAQDVVPFPQERRQFYRGVKTLGHDEGAEYFFEPILAEEAPALAGDASVLGASPKQLRVKLDFDEFVTDLWGKGIRFGIDEAAVRAAINEEKTERVIVAHMLPPLPGKDASVAEQSNALYRDDSPFIRPDGRMDLRHFRNRFPQVKKGTLLFKKLPRTFGKQGWTVAGKAIDPGEPKDFDMSTLAGPGTRLETLPGGEYIVSGMDGFLNLDTHSGQVSVTEKIINRDGVSLRTTGDLALSGDEFEEHGEVQEQRNVEGKSMTFLADVFGNVISSGGVVVFKKNLAGGSAVLRGEGSITVEGNASRATLEAKDGEISLAYAESCFIVGNKVTIDKAVNCDICAVELSVNTAEGCAIAAGRVKVGLSKSRKDVETLISILLPDEAPYVNWLNGLKASLEDVKGQIAAKGKELEAFSESPEVKSYLTLSRKIKANEIRLTKEQEANWQKLLERLAPTLAKIEAVRKAIKEARIKQDGVEVQMQAVQKKAAEAFAAAECVVGSVEGDTVVRGVKAHLMDMTAMPARELRASLRKVQGDRLFSDDSGSFEWKSAPPDLLRAGDSN